MGKVNLEDYLEPQIRVIGPQIGPVFEPCGVKITIAFPEQEMGEIKCILVDERGALKEKNSSPRAYGGFKSYIFEFSDLTPNHKYQYKFVNAGGSAIDLGGDLTEEDCFFYGPAFNDAEDKFVLLSCNNPFESKKPKEEQFAMWEKLLSIVEKDQHVKLIVQGGDQVYNDIVEQIHLHPIDHAKGGKTFPTAMPLDWDKVEKDIRKNYCRFYEHPAYRRILARIPSVAMWDDHDITDGWGGRFESFSEQGKPGYKDHWQLYFEKAANAFDAYQGVKNPTPIHDGVRTTYLDFGKGRLVLCDLRSEKNVNNSENPLVSPDHAAAINRTISDVPDSIQNVLLLFPVVPVRMDPDDEQLAEQITVVSHAIKEHEEEKIKVDFWDKLEAWTLRILKWIEKKANASTYADDLKDALSNSLNRPFLIKLLEEIAEVAKGKSKNFVLLSGDIHTGGISEIQVDGGDGKFISIPQIVSSPMGYTPMPKMAQRSSTTEGNPHLKNPDGTDSGILFRNIYYRSDRNFVLVKPNKLYDRDAVEFVFERLQHPIVSPAYFSRSHI